MKKIFTFKFISTFFIVFFLFLSILSITRISQIKTEYSFKQFLPRTHPLVTNEQKIQETFQLSDIQPFIVIAQKQDPEGSWLTEADMDDLLMASKKFANLPFVEEVSSIPLAKGAIFDEASLKIGSLIQNTSSSHWHQMIKDNKLLSPHLISENSRNAYFYINVHTLNTKDLLQAKQKIETIAKETLKADSIFVSGSPAIQAELSEAILSELKFSILGGFTASVAILFLLFSNVAPILLSSIVVLITNIFALSTLEFIGHKFSALSVMIPVLLSLDVLSISIHSLFRINEENSSGEHKDIDSLLRTSFRLLFRPNLLASSTTIIGFLTLAFVDAPIIREFGFYSSLVLILGWVVATIMIFSLSYFFPLPVPRTWTITKTGWYKVFLQHSLFFISTIVLSALFFALMGSRLSWNSKIFDDLPVGHQMTESSKIIDDEIGLLPINIVLKGPSGYWFTDNGLKDIEVIAAQLKKNRRVVAVSTLGDFINAINLTKDYKSKIVASPREVIFLYSLGENNPLKQYVDDRGEYTRLSLRMKDAGSLSLHQFLEDFRQFSKSQFPALQFNIGGMGFTINNLNEEISKELIFGFWQSMAGIFILLLLIFRSTKWSIIACIPNLIPPAYLLGFLAIAQEPIKPSISIIFSIALGISFNNTIYLLERLRFPQGHLQFGRNPIPTLMEKEGNPCFISSFILIVGFSVFLFSNFKMNYNFGLLMMISFIGGLIGDLILLPSLLYQFPRLLGTYNKK